MHGPIIPWTLISFEQFISIVPLQNKTSHECILGVIRMISQIQNDKGGVLNFIYEVVCELIRLVETTSSLSEMVLYNYGIAGF